MIPLAPLPALASWWQAEDWWALLLKSLVFLLAAWLVHRLAPRLAGPLVRLTAPGGGGPEARQARRETVRAVIASAISFAAFATAVLLCLSLVVSANTLVWVVGLFSAAFGLGARDYVNDILAGLSLILDDVLAVGEKVEVAGVEGVVESVNLRMTRVRAPSGELYVVPNGDVRTVRNFSRGRFSAANVTVRLAAADLPAAISLLEPLGREAVALLPNLIEPWQVISPSGHIGQQTELTLVAKARFGHAAELRPRLLALVHERLAEAGITLVD